MKSKSRLGNIAKELIPEFWDSEQLDYLAKLDNKSRERVYRLMAQAYVAGIKNPEKIDLEKRSGKALEGKIFNRLRDTYPKK